MESKRIPIDDYTLAAFMAGTLSEARREEVAAYLAENTSARELLHMAYEALETSKKSDIPFTGPAISPPADRSARLGTRLLHASRFMVAAMVLVTIGLGFWFAVAPPAVSLQGQDAATSLTRSTADRNPERITVRMATSELHFEWSKDPAAYRYEIKVWDPEAAQTVRTFETKETTLKPEDAAAQTLREVLEVGKTYMFKVESFDARNLPIKSSLMLEFKLLP